jgi:cardiolipin-specific phospholipase
MTLIGHSLGGYLSTAYALRYPSRVDRLVLLSPAGIPENPYAPVNSEGVNIEEFEAAGKELTEPQTAAVKGMAKKEGNTTPLEVKDSNHPPSVPGGTTETGEKKRDNIPKPPTGRSRQRQ